MVLWADTLKEYKRLCRLYHKYIKKSKQPFTIMSLRYKLPRRYNQVQLEQATRNMKVLVALCKRKETI